MSYSNNSQRKALSSSIKDNKLSHAYIICGGNEDSRHVYITETIKEIFCTGDGEHPCGACISCRKIQNGNMEDLIQIQREGSSIKVKQIEELVSALSNKPFTTRNVAVINDAGAMTPESQNKLLKSLEEPAPGTVIILSCDSLSALYPTIRSRCIMINLGSSEICASAEVDEGAGNVVRYAMSNKPFNIVFDQVKTHVDNTSEAEKFLDAMEFFIRDIIVGKYSEKLLFDKAHLAVAEKVDWSKGYPFKKYLTHIQTAKSELKRNLNWKYCMKNMIIKFKQEELHG